MAELADAPDLGSGAYGVGVRVPLAAPYNDHPTRVPMGTGLVFLLYL